MTRARMVVARCVSCDSEFERRVVEEWRVRCIACWRVHRGIVPAPAYDPIRDELRDSLRPLLSLCHPDKHAGSALATRTTQWLLAMRDRLGSAS